MIKQVTWADYWSAVTILLLIFYMAVIAVYYSEDIRNFIIKRRYKRFPSHRGDVSHQSSSSSDNSSEADLFKIAQNLIEELNQIIEVAESESYTRDQLIGALRFPLKTSLILKGSAFEVSVNNFLIAKARMNCSIQLSEDDLREVWV